MRSCVAVFFAFFCLTLIQVIPLANPWLSESSAQEQTGKEPSPEGTSDAERIINIQSSLDADQKKRDELAKEMKGFQDEFDDATAKLKKLSDQLVEKKKELEDLTTAGKSVEAKELEAEIEKLEKNYSLVKQRSDVLFDARKNLQQQINVLKEKIEKDNQILQDLKGLAMPETKKEPPAVAAPAVSPETAAPPPSPAVPGMPALPAGEVPEGKKMPPAEEPTTAEQIAARKDTERKEEEAQKAEKTALDYAARKKSLEDQIALQEKLIVTAEEALKYLEETLQVHKADLEKKISAGASQAELNTIRNKIRENNEEIVRVQERIKKEKDTLEVNEKEVRQLEEEQDELFREAEAKRKEAEAARKRSVWLESPLHPKNILRWAYNRIPRMLLVIIAMAALLLIVRMFSQRTAEVIVKSGRGTTEDREKRSHTLSSTFRGALSGIIIIGGMFVLLEEAGMDVKTVLGGAAVIGLAFAFGAQNLMRDYFNGFMILLEGQYQLNDVIIIGDVAGLVERMTMRITVLRDLDGRVHFIPNGQITRVSNLTHEWSRALFDIVVTYEGNVDRAMEILVELANEIRKEPEYAGFITGEPEMLGVDQFTESGVLIKMIMQTKAGKMWPVRRELLRRIKNKFDEEGIEIAIPHRVIYQRGEKKDS